MKLAERLKNDPEMKPNGTGLSYKGTSSYDSQNGHRLTKRQEEFQKLQSYIESLEKRGKMYGTTALEEKKKLFMLAFPGGKPA